MRAVRYHEFGGPEKLQIEQIPQPELDGENVLIQITRAGVSPLDDKVRGGILPPTMRKPLPLVPGASAVGRVADPGPSGHAPGTRVLLCGWGYGTKLDGTWREFAAVPSSHLVPIPDGVSNDDAAGLVAGAGYLTAWLALTKVTHLQPGQVVLAPGIYGAVASAAAQVAPILGASIAVVAGHKDPSRTDDPRILDETAEYLQTARQVIAEKPTAREFFDEMTRRYPERINPGTVWLNAQRLA